jgi:hypothetical protein
MVNNRLHQAALVVLVVITLLVSFFPKTSGSALMFSLVILAALGVTDLAIRGSRKS